uniref:C2H2-type domain-containing protein n=2 Tax=Schistocephalus solidus TaxID=70667 RepID=A0A0X3PDN2_SCHSO
MSSAADSLLLIGIKHEESISNREVAYERSKASESIPPNRLRLRRRLYAQQDSEPSGSDWASSGDEWQPSPSPTSLSSSGEVNNEMLPPTVPSSYPTGDLNAVTCLSIPTKASDPTTPMDANTSGRQYSDGEVKEPSCKEPAIHLGGDRSLPLREYTCEFCGKAFVKIGRLNEHVNGVHKKLRRFRCELCSKTFAKRSHMNSHIDSVHNNIRRWTCEFCCKGFTMKGSLNKHIDCIHKQLRDFSCELCGKTFARKGDLKKHSDLTHKKLRRYPCEVCAKAFATTAHLKAHVDTVHKKLRDFVCNICGKVFSRNGHLKRHVDGIHKKLREHTCELCGKVLANVGHMRRHVNRIHKKLREHTCEYCGKAFADIDDVKRHVNGIHKSMCLFLFHATDCLVRLVVFVFNRFSFFFSFIPPHPSA